MGRQIPSPRRNHFSGLVNPIARRILFSGPANLITAPQSFQRAGVPHRCAAIISAGRQIPSRRRNLFSGPAKPITALQSFQRAGESHRRAAIISAGWQIPSPRHHLFSGPANPIAVPQSFQWSGESHHQKQHHVPYSLAISINGTFLLIHGIASTLWAFQYVFLIIFFRYFLFLVIFSCPIETVPYLRNFSFQKFGFPSIFIFLYFHLI